MCQVASNLAGVGSARPGRPVAGTRRVLREARRHHVSLPLHGPAVAEIRASVSTFRFMALSRPAASGGPGPRPWPVPETRVETGAGWSLTPGTGDPWVPGRRTTRYRLRTEAHRAPKLLPNIYSGLHMWVCRLIVASLSEPLPEGRWFGHRYDANLVFNDMRTAN